MTGRSVGPDRAWIAAGALAFALLPWYALPDNFAWSKDATKIFSAQDAATGVLQLLRFGRWWLAGPLLGLFIAAASLFTRGRRTKRLPTDERLAADSRAGAWGGSSFGHARARAKLLVAGGGFG